MTEFFVFLLAVTVHELGHVAVAALVGVPLLSISVRPIGLSLHFDFSGVSFLTEAAVHAGGSFAGLIAAALAVFLPWRAALTFSGVSAVFAILNLLPTRSFDGGALLSSVLSCFLLPDAVWRISRAVSCSVIVCLWIAALWLELRVGANMALLGFVCALLIHEIDAK